MNTPNFILADIVIVLSSVQTVKAEVRARMPQTMPDAALVLR